jgi:hypothetical protein
LPPAGTVFPFVSLRETGERKETAALPGRHESGPPSPFLVDEAMAVDLDYPRSAYAHGIEDE